MTDHETPLDPKVCPHDDTDRVGTDWIVCFQCMHEASISHAVATGTVEWIPLGGHK